MKFTTTLAILTSLAIGVNAQTPSSCVLTCSQQAATAAGCSSFADPVCVCTNVAFQNAAQQCLVANCTPEEQAQALSLQASLCPNGAVSGVSSLIASSILSQTSSVALPTGAAASSISASVESMSSMMSSSMMMSSSSAAAASTGASSSQGVVSSIASSIASRASSAVGGATSTAAGGGTQVPASSAPANSAQAVEVWGMGGKVVAGVVGLVGVGAGMVFGL